jgi:hypothetical protein
MEELIIDWKKVKKPKAPDENQSESQLITLMPKVISPAASSLLGGFDYGEFEYYIVITDFNVSLENIVKTQTVRGVETIRGISRYRLKIALNPLMDQNDVIEDVSNSMREYYRGEKPIPAPATSELKPTPEGMGYLQEFVDYMRTIVPNANVVQTDDGLFFVGSSTEDSFYDSAVRILQEKQKISGGIYL